jgi:hypothetical protein
MLFIVFLLADFSESRLFSGFKIPHKNIHETGKLESIRGQHLAEMKDDGRKTDKNFSLRRLESKPRNLE